MELAARQVAHQLYLLVGHRQEHPLRTAAAAVIWAKAQITHPTQDWQCKCESFTRQALGLPAYAASAKIAAGEVPVQYRNAILTAKDWKSIPAGAQILLPSMGAYGHAYLSIGDGQVISTDYKRRGQVDICPADLPNWHAANYHPFWTFWTPQGITAH